MKYTKEELIQIGHNLASIWGGKCVEVDINEEDKNVTFECMENGEKFHSIVDFKDLNKYEK